MGGEVEVISRVERRRRWSEAEKAALLAETDQPGATVASVSRRHGVAESVLYGWRAIRRAVAVAAAGGSAEDLRFIPLATIGSPSEGAGPTRTVDPAKRRRRAARDGEAEIALPNGTRLKGREGIEPEALQRLLTVVKGAL
ncbi:IS66-like element accessory protein TnpA [Zavarzinia compransoris]|uniref:Transposase n=1 Tax=Zavarzinia compransoris TaxID=1264899 RepID=A0A317EB29_9PROT|nr:transposase [Zavarzinia compransoris]PWR22395.1 hypothetical protein DKG75_05850 [Zavarzinia compransoris]TDP45704.1 transposase [Zavarzinia compransoris]